MSCPGFGPDCDGSCARLIPDCFDDEPRFTSHADCTECDGAGYVEEYEGGRVRRVQCGTCEERKDKSE